MLNCSGEQNLIDLSLAEDINFTKQLFFVTSVNILLKPMADYSETQQWLVYIPQRLTLEEAIAIAQNKDATASQVGYKYATRVQRQSDPRSSPSTPWKVRS